MSEKWLPVVGFEGHYEISDHGRLRSLDRLVRNRHGLYLRPGHIFSPALNSYGRPQTMINRPGERPVTVAIHTLVAAAFLGPRPEGMVVLHWDDNPTNNHLGNLRYGTESENRHDCVRNGNDWNAGKRKCKRGHEFTPENTRVYKDGEKTKRACRKCRKWWRANEKYQKTIAANTNPTTTPTPVGLGWVTT